MDDPGNPLHQPVVDLVERAVTGCSRRLAGVRLAFNAAAPSLKAARLPPPGGELHHLSAVHVCVPPGAPEVLRALVVDAYNELRGSGYSFYQRRPRRDRPALQGVVGTPGAADRHLGVCMATLDGAGGPSLDGRPVHHEIALA